MDSENKNKIHKNHKNFMDEARCMCGQLVAKIRGKNLELKCKRCKRIVSIPYSGLKEIECTIALH